MGDFLERESSRINWEKGGGLFSGMESIMDLIGADRSRNFVAERFIKGGGK